MSAVPELPAVPRRIADLRCSACQQPVARHRRADGRSLDCEQVLRMATERCGYCGHLRGDHDRPEPGNPAPSLRCGSGCVCAAFIERDGRPDWAQSAARVTAENDPKPARREPLDISGWALVGTAASDRDATVLYELRQEPAGERRIGCTCPGWTNRWTCKHVDRFVAQAGVGGATI